MDTAVEVVQEETATNAKPLRIAIIGCGGIAQTHMGYYKKFPGVSIVAGADILQAPLDRMRDVHGVPETHLFKDFNEMLSKVGNDIDAVSVCAPNGVHAPATIASANAGKHILGEKPMAMSPEEAQAMADAAKANDIRFVIGFQHRYEPRSQFLRDLINSGALGDILYVRAQALRRRGIPNWGVFGRKEMQGGGPMIDIGVHILETAHSLIGTPKPVAATGNTFTFMGNQPSSVKSMWPKWDWETYTVEDMAVGMIRFDTGTMLTLESSFVAHIPEDVFDIQIFGTRGGARWGTSEVYTDFHDYMVNMTPGHLPKWDMWEYKMRHFVDVARGERENEAPPEHGVMVQKMLNGIYAAADAGKEIEIS